MANLGYVSTFNINGNELTLKDAALTEIVNEIIEAIGANNTNIAERINDLHNRSFDNTIKISSQNESEIASIQDGLYKIQYVTVTGEGDNATETLNDSAILIQKETNQYLYKDGQISSRIKEDNFWDDWITPEIISFDYEIIFSSGSTSSTEYNRHYGGIFKFTGDSGFGTNGIIICGESNHYAFTNTGIYHREYISGNDYTNWAPLSLGVTSFNGATGAITYTAPVTSVNGMTGAVTIPDAELSSNYATSTDTNDDLLLASGDTYEEAFGKLEKAILDNSEVAATAIQEVASNSSTAIQEVASNMVTSVNGQTGDVTITIPEGQLSNDYAMSTATNDDLELASGDTYETAFSKLEKAIIDNELVVTAAITDLDSRVTDTESLATVAKSGSYNDLTNRPTIPTKTSDLTNDSGFLTSAPVTSVNGQQGAVTLTLGQTNVIETVKVNNTALTPDANKAVNIDLTDYDKAPLVIEVNDTDATVPSGTYASITAALAIGREAIVKVINDTGDSDHQYYYITNDHAIVGDGFYEFSSPAKGFYLFRVQIYDDDTFGIYGNDESDMFITSGDAQSITGYKDFTVSPTVPTAESSSNNTTAASTAFVKTALSNQTHGNITNDGKLQTSDISIANGDKLVVTDSSDSSKIARTSVSFDGSTTTKALTPKGTWETFLQSESSLSKGTTTGNGNAVTDINVSNHQITLVKGKTFLETAPVTSVNNQTGDVTLALGDTNVIETIKVNNTALTPVSKAVNITVPTKVSDLTNDSNFTSNTGTITGITMNGVSKGTSGVVNLGTVLTEHQDISGKVDKVTGMGLSSNDYTTTEKNKLAGINIGSLDNLTTAELNSIFATS